jgi:DNA-binding response OmpR family regulator
MPRRHLTVLLCDPSHDQREMYAEALHRAGYHVIDCADGRIAFGVALRVPVATLITEVGADGEGCGWTLINRLRDSASTAGVPIIALVSRDVTNDRTRAADVGADRCMTVPLMPDELIDAVAELASASRRRTPPR